MMQVLVVPKTKTGGRRRFIPAVRDQEVAANIRAKREAKKLNQVELANAAGISERTLIRYEQAARAIPEQILARIEGVIGPCRPESEGLGGVSDPGSKMLPGLGGFLERYGNRLHKDELAFLRGGVSFRRSPGPHAKMDDAWWWNFVRGLGLGDDS